MASRIHYTNCPVCGSAGIRSALSAKDYTVSAEEFDIAECDTCGVRLTQDVPDATAISSYYKSGDYISHSNTSRGLINRLYQMVRKRTVKRKRRLVQQVTGLKTGSLLDLGSGTGAFVHEMTKNGWKATGLEPDRDARTLSRELYNRELLDINYFYELKEGVFDAITLWHVLEHVHELQAYVARLKALLKENGKLFIAVPNYTSKDAAVYREYWAAYDVPRHLYHFSPGSMRKLMEKNGLHLLGYKPMWYDSFYISMLSSKYKNGKTNLPASVWNGFRSNLKALADTRKCSSVIYIIGK